jgi:phage terminase large subunit
MSLKIQTTVVFQHLIDAEKQNKRVVVAQGGSRSGKTRNILIWWVQKLLQENNKTLSIVRKTLPSLKQSVLKDVIEVLEQFNLFDPNKYHKQEGYFELPNGCQINFFSIDEPQKLRGSKRDYLYINEANELTLEDWRQLLLRTESTITLDLNPSELSSWVYDLEQREDCYYFKTNWKDNPFIPQTLIDEIERLKETDENYYRIFGLGEKGIPTTLVFNTYHFIEEIPANAKLLGRGMDFGFNNATTLIEVYKNENDIYLHEKLYVRNMTMGDIIYRMDNMEIPKSDEIFCDSALPQNIEELRRVHYNAKPVSKKSILHGIDLIKRHKVHITQSSSNIIKEFQNYKWKTDKDGNLLDAPEDDWNHCIDSVRYVMEMKVAKNTGVYVF